jgi:hypothetical protein
MNEKRSAGYDRGDVSYFKEDHRGEAIVEKSSWRIIYLANKSR